MNKKIVDLPAEADAHTQAGVWFEGSTVWTLSNDERDFFLALLESPDAEPTPSARRAAERYNQWSLAQQEALRDSPHKCAG